MFTHPRRQGAAQVYLLLSIAFFAVFLALAIYEYLNGTRFSSNQDLVAELQQATLLEEANPASNKPDWPQWRGPTRDGVSPEKDLVSDWPSSGPKVRWKADCGEGYSSVSVANGRAITLFQTDDSQREVVICWDADTGKKLWEHDYSAPYVSDQGSGPRSTPTIEGDRVYTVGATGILHCLDAKTGKPVWRKDLLAEFGAKNLQWGVSFSPLTDGDLLITNPGGPDGNSIVAFNKVTGDVVWKSFNEGAGYSSPIALTINGTRQVVVFTAKSLVGITEADGRLLWRYPWETSYDVNAATPLPIRAKVGDAEITYLFISSGYNKGCALLKIASTGGGEFAAQKVFESNLMRNHFSSSVRYQDHLYGFDQELLVCMDLRSGNIKWNQSGFHKGSLILSGDHLIIVGETGKLAVAEASPSGYHEKGSYRIFRRKSWTPPSLANGKLYLRDQQQVLCLDLKK